MMGLFFIFACTSGSKCHELNGGWSDREGHDFVFKNDGKALWINKFGQMMDTVNFVFSINCNTKPASVDFKDFSGGPFLGKTLFGIIEWSSDTLFNLCYEAGQQPDCRPQSFDPEQTMKFYIQR
jgi:hypothetical protein